MAACVLGLDAPNVTPSCPCVSPHSSLTSDQGSDLMERLTQRLNLHAADLTQLSYVQTNPQHTPTYDDLPYSMQAIHRTKNNWQHLEPLKCFCFLPLSSEKQSEGCPGATRTVCAKTFCHTARDCRRLLFF